MPRMSAAEIKTIIETGLSKLSFDDRARSSNRSSLCPRITSLRAPPWAICRRELAHESVPVEANRPEIVQQAINVAIEKAQQSIKTAWHTATTSPRKDNLFADVLIACATAETDDLGYFAAQDVRTPLRRILERPMNIANYAQHLADFCSSKKGPCLTTRRRGAKVSFSFHKPTNATLCGDARLQIRRLKISAAGAT